MKKFTLILILFLISCSSIQNKVPYCIKNNSFNIEITSNNLSKIERKIILNDIINNSAIKFDKDSDYKIDIRILKRVTDSLITDNNESDLQNIIFNIYLTFFDMTQKKIIYNDRIIINISSNISDNRFRNYTMEAAAMENFSLNLVDKLNNKIDMVLKNNKCKN